MAKSRGGIDWIKCDGSLPLSEVLRAASAMPIFYGKEVAIGGERYLDGGVVETVGISKALSLGSDNILAILTRPLMSQQRSYGEDRVARFLAKKKGHSPFIQESVAAIDNSFAKVQSLALDPKSSLFAIAPSSSLVSRLTRSKKKLQEAVVMARRDVFGILNG